MLQMILQLDGTEVAQVEDEESLREALKLLGEAADDQTVRLSSGPKHFIQAQQDGGLWVVDERRGPWWTGKSFARGISRPHHRRKRWGARKGEFETAQVEAMFANFLAGRPNRDGVWG
jgi:hypothetical protein